MNIRFLIPLTIAATALAPHALLATDCTRPMLMLTVNPSTGAEAIYRFDPNQPGDLGSPIALSGYTLSNVPQCLQVDTASGDLFTVLSDSTLAKVDPSTGVVNVIGPFGVSVTTPAWLGFDPVSRDLLLVDSAGTQFTVNKTTGSFLAARPGLAFASSDVLSGSTLYPRNFIFVNDHPGATVSKMLMLDLYNQVLTNVGGSDLASVFTIGYTGTVSAYHYAFADSPDQNLYVATSDGSLAPFFRLYRVDRDTGLSTYLGALPLVGEVPLDLCFDFDPDATDHDCDGYPSAIEQVVAANRFDATETPFPLADSAPTTTTVTTLATKLKIELDFATPTHDRLTLKGKIATGEPGIALEGKRMIFDVGGKLFAFTLGANGKATDGLGGKLAVKRNATTGLLKFTLTAKNIDLQADLADEGLVNTTAAGTSHSVTCEVWMTDLRHSQAKPLLYNATAGGSGTAK